MAMEYRDIATHQISAITNSPSHVPLKNEEEDTGTGKLVFTEEEFAERLKSERLEAARQLEERLRGENEQKLHEEHARITNAIRAFEAERESYFSRVESEVVQLALGIAAKILHRETQVDPMLVAALVRMAIERMHEGSSVTVRVSPSQAVRCRSYFVGQPNMACVRVAEDSSLTDHDCFLETELGNTNFGLDTQLKEIEQGFFDLLALKPVNR
jgi:flagellar assembly protein FliH